MVIGNADAHREDGNVNHPHVQHIKPDSRGMDANKALHHADKLNNLHNEQTSPSLHKIRSSFNDLVIYNEQGQPYLDVNRLVYKPKKNKHNKEKEKLSWYLPDYMFIIANFLTLTYSTYYFINGITIISWRNRFMGHSDPSWEGMLLMVFGTCNVLNVMIGIYGCLKGCKKLLISHLMFDLGLVIFEFITISVMKSHGHCDFNDMEIVSAFLQRQVQNYGQNVPSRDVVRVEAVKKDTIALDLLQISLGCCGVGNWTDYLPRSTWNEKGELLESSLLIRSNLDKSDLIIPPSCCRQWWVRNIYCAHSAHLWAYPTVSDLQAHQLRQRINQFGCLPKMYGLCQNMVIMAGVGAMVAWTLHFIFSTVKAICAVVQIQTISTLVRERKRIFRDKEKENDYIDIIDDDEEDVYPSLSSIFDDDVSETDAEMSVATRKTALPHPPKEEDIVRLKSRRHISRLTARMKNTHIDQWLAASRAFVEGNGPDGTLYTPSKVHVYGNLPIKKKTELARQKEIMKIQEQFRAADDDYVESEMTKSRMLLTTKPISTKSDEPDMVETLKLLQMHHDKSGGTGK